jgi:hypothetical protein
VNPCSLMGMGEVIMQELANINYGVKTPVSLFVCGEFNVALNKLFGVFSSPRRILYFGL